MGDAEVSSGQKRVRTPSLPCKGQRMCMTAGADEHEADFVSVDFIREILVCWTLMWPPT
jgi:hypothetical protein